MPSPAPYPELIETDAERRARLTLEAAAIEEGLAGIEAGRVVTFEAFSAWVDSLGTPNELPPPRSDLPGLD